jgi:hypothetical protein
MGSKARSIDMNEISKANLEVYRKLAVARARLRAQVLKKSGLNKFAGYQYFELGDFLHPTLEIFDTIGLIGIVSFTKDEASLCIVDVDGGGEIVITSPFGSAALKGCHEVQNIGAVETYQRRYLWVAAMEIVEHDALDATTGRKGDGPIISPRGQVGVDDKRMNIITDVSLAIQERMEADDLIGAYEEYIGITDGEEKIALWGMLDSKTRSALKKHGETIKGR